VARQRADEQLREAQKMDALGSLAAGIAHDFNNLLSVILTYSHFALTDLDPQGRTHMEVQQIERAGHRARELTQQLLAFCRRQAPKRRMLDLNSVAREMQVMLHRLLGASVHLSVDLGSRLGQIRADQSQIEQVVMNLAVNARDAMPEGGVLTIRTANVELDQEHADRNVGVAPGPHVMLSVADSGVGIDEATKRRLFEPFFTTKAEGRGTGLGLANVLAIVQQSGGSIDVLTHQNAGTEFRLYFPRAAEGTGEISLTAPFRGRLSGTETILLVEDEDCVRQAMRRILSRSGYNVLDAQNAGDALLVSEQYPAPIHLLLSDVVMPRMNGKQLAARLAWGRPEMSVLFCSGYTDAVLSSDVPNIAGAFCQKPVTPEVLLSKVREVLDGAAADSGPVSRGA
jgi:CheY-like chemotaxis protein